jgi:uncharacterized membrane protein
VKKKSQPVPYLCGFHHKPRNAGSVPLLIGGAVVGQAVDDGKPIVLDCAIAESAVMIRLITPRIPTTHHVANRLIILSDP